MRPSFLQRPLSTHLSGSDTFRCVTESLVLKPCGRVFDSLILGSLVLQIFGSLSGQVPSATRGLGLNLRRAQQRLTCCFCRAEGTSAGGGVTGRPISSPC